MAPSQLELKQLIEHLRQTSRTRVGLWRMPINRIGQEKAIAIRIGAEAIDISAQLQERLPGGAEFVRLTEQKIIETLDHIASMPGSSDCVLTYNFDLLLAGIKSDDRQLLWQSLFNGFPNRTRALLLAVPETAINLLPSDAQLERWKADHRLI